MAEPNPYSDKFKDIFGRREYDEHARTIAELSEDTGISQSHMAKRVKGKIATGEIEQVWKHANGKTVAAYRPVNHASI
jgi:hypothetical protein